MKIGEAAQAVEVNPKTLRYYEEVGVLPGPVRTPSGYRDYAPQDVDRLIFVKGARRLGFTLAEIREVLAFRERGERPCTYVLSVLDRQVDDLDRRITELKELRADLVAMKAEADHLPREDLCYCSVIEHAVSASGAP